jgi:uncharacterized protein (TIGR03083 family)
MAALDAAQHIDAIEVAGALLARAASHASPDARVPSCPDWDMRELVRHQGGIHRWATSIVATPRTEFWNVDLPEVVGEWPDDSGLVAWFEAGCRDLVDALRAAPDDLACWTFLAAPSPKQMWARRQAHETTIHRVDAELAASVSVSAVPADLAADGVDELLSCFVPRSRTRLRSDAEQTLAVVAGDVGEAWVLTIGPEGVTTQRASDAGSAADCTVAGSAEDLYLALWNRAVAGGLDVAGDPTVFGLFADAVHIRWS